MSMKQTILTAVFILYQFFTPFVFVDCGGEDIPYDLTNIEDDANADESVTEKCDRCDQDEFLTQACADLDCESAGTNEEAGQ